MDEYYQVKLFIEQLLGVEMDTLHVLIGVVLQFLAAAVLRMPVSRIWPWLVVLLLELANEALDLAMERWPDPGQQYGEGAKDLLLTMALPTLILLLARYCPRLFVAPRDPAPAPETEPQAPPN
jgi:hypothetical protein